MKKTKIPSDSSGVDTKADDQDFKSSLVTPLLKQLRNRKVIQEKLFKALLFKSIKSKLLKKDKDAEPRMILNSKDKEPEAVLAKADTKIGEVLGMQNDQEKDGGESKYKNIDSVLKYVESPDDKGTVKLIIMNFND